MTGLDWIAVVLVLVFVIRGTLRGTIAQVFAFFGMLAGLAATVAVAAWVGSHWREARPGPVYFVLRWLVAILAGMAISALFHWWGELVAKAAHDGPFGWLDRLVGDRCGVGIGDRGVDVEGAVVAGDLFAASDIPGGDVIALDGLGQVDAGGVGMLRVVHEPCVVEAEDVAARRGMQVGVVENLGTRGFRETFHLFGGENLIEARREAPSDRPGFDVLVGKEADTGNVAWAKTGLYRQHEAFLAVA